MMLYLMPYFYLFSMIFSEQIGDQDNLKINNIQRQQEFLQSEFRTITQQRNQISNEMGSQSKKQRMTQTGEKCLRYWYINGELINGCTIKTNPDGEESSREWCRTQNVTPTGKQWDYCTDDMDFDQVRQAVHEFYGEDSKFMTEIAESIGKSIPIAMKALGQLESIQKIQQEIVSNLMGQNQSVKYLHQMIELIKSIFLHYKDVQNNVDQILKTNKLQEKVDPFKLSFWCKGLQYYEEPGNGDGFTAYFFSNEFFQGQDIQENYDELEFDFDSLPHSKIYENNFSVILKGLIRAPITDDYTFRIFCDAGVSLMINDETLIDHFMTDPKKGFQNKQWGEFTESAEVYLNSGSFYKFMIKYYTHTHQIYQKQGKPYLKVQWQSKKLETQELPQSVLFRNLPIVPIQIFDYQEQDIHLSNIRDWDYAFKDDQNYLINDLPLNYQSSLCLKLNINYLKETIHFTVNEKFNLFIATDSGKPFPLDSTFQSTQEKLSVLKVDPTNQEENPPILSSLTYKIFAKYNIEGGPVKLNFKL